MFIAANVVIALVAILHIWFMILEMYFWDKPIGLRAFGLNKETAAASKSLAANQGLYNGFLAAGLFWGLIIGSSGTNILIFFLICIIVAGIFGALTASRKIIFIQAIPAAVALTLLLIK